MYYFDHCNDQNNSPTSTWLFYLCQRLLVIDLSVFIRYQAISHWFANYK